MRRWKFKFDECPLLTKLVITQFFVLLSCLLLLLLTVSKVTASGAAAEMEQKQRIAEAKLKPLEKQIRTWHFLGMQSAVDRAVAELESSSPGLKISLRPNRGGNERSDQDAIVFPDPAGQGDEIPVDLVASVGTSDALFHDRSWIVTMVSVIGMGVVFLLTVLWSAVFVRRNFLLPITALDAAFSKLSSGGRLDVATIPATGEVARLIANISQMYESYRTAEAERAIARMTQMLAHDVRKPFSILKMGLTMVGNAQDILQMKRVLDRVGHEVDRAVRSVNGLIEDIMEIGAPNKKLMTEPVALPSLIESTIGDLCRVYPQMDVQFSYDLRHTHQVDGHAGKLGRVFSNIVGNACQAMQMKGGVWFKTEDVTCGDRPFVKIVIGNGGSYIGEDSLPKLFDAFFTSGKKNGTGLGLAIAQKVVLAHGGKIWCESSKSPKFPNGKVEFFLTLPSHPVAVENPAPALPASSRQVRIAFASLPADAPKEAAREESVSSLEMRIITAAEERGSPFRILIVDDEAIYRDSLAALVRRTPEIERAITVVFAADGESAVQTAARESFDLVISDYDLGPTSLNGCELAQELRNAGRHLGLLCIHSNRVTPQDQKRFEECGADQFLAKPMGRSQLLRMVLGTAKPHS